MAGKPDVRPGHLVHVMIEIDSSDQTMSLTGAVRRVRSNGNSGGLAIAFPVLSPDQEDAIHDAVLRALVRRDEVASRLPLLVFEPRRRVREEIESEIRSFGTPTMGVESLADAVRELENDETEYGALVVHSVTHDSRAMEVVEFFARSEDLRTIILPDPDGTVCACAKRLAQLPQVRIPRIWSRSELRSAVSS